MKQTATVELAGGKTLHLETGHLAKQAHGSTIARLGDNVVLGTACANPEPRLGIDFFPLTVDYREYTYAGGRIPGGFIKSHRRNGTFLFSSAAGQINNGSADFPDLFVGKLNRLNHSFFRDLPGRGLDHHDAF